MTYFDTSKYNCRILLDTLIAKGVKEFIVSPGSRNAPLIIGLENRKNIKIYRCTDERTAGFMALGLSLVKQSPVALCCTSGTALYNYAPAIAEAFYQKIPLIVLSADRPIQWIGQDDSQTLFQFDSLSKIVKRSFEIPDDNPSSKDMDWYVNRLANEAINVAMQPQKGPVHINIRFDNPLSNLSDIKDKSNIRIIDNADVATYNPLALRKYGEMLKDKKILIVAGFMPPDNKLNRVLQKYESIPNVKILCETLSNLHLKGNPYAIDRIFSVIENSNDSNNLYENLRPDIVIAIGGALVSRKLKEFIRQFTPKEMWTLADTDLSVDCFKSLTKHFNIFPTQFFTGIFRYISKNQTENVEDGVNTKISYNQRWKNFLNISYRKDEEFFANCKCWSELYALKSIFNNINPSTNLFLSNGTVVRYGQLFAEIIPHAVYGNRGVSGIEGTNATALGVSIGYNNNTILITGDMSFSYDTAVLGLKKYSNRLKIIVINNSGGGIFRFIPVSRNLDCREDAFCVDPKVPVKGLASAYGWEYIYADNSDDFDKKFKEFEKFNGNAILELKFDPETSSKHLLEYFNYTIK
ncbi:MAG: 2-succinyl-5-enolpyruvyl-6-hydroxy-3-cyclohexene-1-carboxylic-acid synthase [Roseburia sp.]|nr:2-succinyl-5-enolpyruvyl-6-hydroxy-3-cyclohexene-1-carboxylic-acid synthase [Roseburia sp.]